MEKTERGRVHGVFTNFFGCPLLSQERVKLRTSNFVGLRTFYRLNRNKSSLKISRKVALCVVRDSRKFAGHPYIGRIARSVIFPVAQLSCLHGAWLRNCLPVGLQLKKSFLAQAMHKLYSVSLLHKTPIAFCMLSSITALVN